MPPLAAVLFDVDETLYDRRAAQGLILRHLAARLPGLFEGCAFEAMAAAFAESDRQTAEHFMTTASIGASRDARSRIFLEELGRPAARAREVSEAYVAAYRRTAAPVPGAVETVARCARHLPVGVVSNAFPDVQYDKLRAIGLEGAFQCVLLSEEVGVRKPDPRIFHQACAALGAEPG
ncbi:MAG: HAD family hydrolase, partial [Gemmatimonadota bacterium]